MHPKQKLAGAAAVLVVLGGLGTVTAFAQSSGTSTPPPAPASGTVTKPAAPEADTVQSGDQTTPDVAGAPETPDATEKADKGTTSETKTGTDADGPGGHADPSGNVDNQQEGNN